MTEERETVLVVDDEPDICWLIQRVLESAGYQVITAVDGNQALDLVARRNPDLVLLDIKMPGKSGIEVFQELRTGHPNTGVIMATAVGDVNVAIDTLREGALDYLIKPFNVNELVISVTGALEKRRLVLENRDYQQHLEDKVAEQARKIRASFLNAITALAYALEAKDKYTLGHSQRVADISVAIAKKMGLPEESVDKVNLAGLVHDIGKIGIRESVLNKPGRLTGDEFQHIQKHPEIGERILTMVAEDEEILRLVRNHHERYDGSGYPDRLKGGQIPLGARVLAISDAYEAMTSERPYRKAMSSQVACNEIERGKGTQFDPQVVDAFLSIKTATGSAVLKEANG